MKTKPVTLSAWELRQHKIINQTLEGKLTNSQAATELGLTIRQVQRLKIKVREGGVKELSHKNRGRKSNNQFFTEYLEHAMEIIKEKYYDFGPTLAAEKLLENHGIKLGKETVRKFMGQAGLWQPKSRKLHAHYRAWRERKQSFGEMQQFDGSYHDWFEGRLLGCDGQPLKEICLLAAIDDATGRLTKLKFDQSEGVVPVSQYWLEYVKTLGKPLKIYLDRFSTYKINNKHLFDDPNVLTQFERTMKELSVDIIHAHSPQGKGRIERLFKTLQDRLLKELRLEGINTIAEANKFLEKTFIPKFNEKFSVVPKKPDNLHTPLTATELARINNIFSIQAYRNVNNDFTIRFKSKWLQLKEQQPTLVLRKDQVLVEEHLDGTIHLNLRNKYLDFTELPQRPEKVKMRVTGLARERQLWKPPMNHPWKKLAFEKAAADSKTSTDDISKWPEGSHFYLVLTVR
jgi:transposase